MILDKKFQLSGAIGATPAASGQAVTATAATTDVADVGSAYADIGSSNRLYMVFTVLVAAAATGGDSNVTFSAQTSADETDGNFVNTVASAPIAKGTLVAGYQVVLPLPPGQKQYIRGKYTVDTNNLTSGRFSCHIVDAYQRNIAYPDAVAASAV